MAWTYAAGASQRGGVYPRGGTLPREPVRLRQARMADRLPTSRVSGLLVRWLYLRTPPGPDKTRDTQAPHQLPPSPWKVKPCLRFLDALGMVARSYLAVALCEL